MAKKEKKPKKQIKVIFDPLAEEKLNILKNGNKSDRELYKHIMRTVDTLKMSPKKSGRFIKPEIRAKSKKYKNYKNLYAYDLPGAWRLLYTVKETHIVVEDVILDWGNHKWYDKEFGFKAGFFFV